MDDLASRLALRVQMSSDALAAYPDAFERSFGSDADYGQIVKTYSVTPLGNAAAPAAVRYSPAEAVKVERTIVSGIIFAIYIGLGVWLALGGYIKIVIFLIAALVLIVTIQFGVGWVLVGIGRIRKKLKRKKPN